MKPYTNILLGLILLMNLSLCTGLSGFIRNDNDGEPIAYASIIIKKSLIGTTSDIYGYFVIPNIPAGEHKVDISMIGYKTVTRNIIIDDTDCHQSIVPLLASSQNFPTCRLTRKRSLVVEPMETYNNNSTVQRQPYQFVFSSP